MVVVLVAVVFMIVIMVMVVAARAKPLSQHRTSDRDDEHAGDEGEPWVELLGDDERREPESHEPEGEDAGGVRDRHRPSKEQGIARTPPRADEVCGDHRLAVPG